MSLFKVNLKFEFTVGEHTSSSAHVHLKLRSFGVSASSRLSLWSAQPGPQHCSRESIPQLSLPPARVGGRILSQQQAQTLTVLRGAQIQHTHGLCTHMHSRPLPFSPMHTFRASYKAADPTTKLHTLHRGEWG